MPSSAHPFLNADQARTYESWYSGPGRRADTFEKRLLRWCIGQFPDARSILEVGCGTGHFSRWFAGLGFEVIGLDNSPAMLREARAHGTGSYVEGNATALPMLPRSIDLVALITALEFIRDPVDALSEAMRVARQGLILGVLNRTSLLGWRRKRAGEPVWSAATFFSPAELLGRVRQAGGDRVRSIRWRTTLWPRPLTGSLPLPWGAFIGMAVKLEHQTRSSAA
jgi:SAM-dependent methyltransferase